MVVVEFDCDGMWGVGAGVCSAAVQQCSSAAGAQGRRRLWQSKAQKQPSVGSSGRGRKVAAMRQSRHAPEQHGAQATSQLLCSDVCRRSGALVCMCVCVHVGLTHVCVFCVCACACACVWLDLGLPRRR